MKLQREVRSGAKDVARLAGVSTASVGPPITEVGRAAADLLVARLEGQPCDSFQSFPVELVHRGSTAPPAH